MRTEDMEEYLNQRVAIVLDGVRNPTFYGTLTELQTYFAVLENSNGRVKLQSRQIVGISPYFPKATNIGKEGLEVLEAMAASEAKVEEPEPEETGTTPKAMKKGERAYWVAVNKLRQTGILRTGIVMEESGTSRGTALNAIATLIQKFPEDIRVIKKNPYIVRIDKDNVSELLKTEMTMALMKLGNKQK